jgi:hypothetical protein
MPVSINNTTLTFNDATTQTTAGIGASSVIGLSQTYQNVTGSRSSGTVYTNSTGKGIYVSIFTGDAAGQGAALNMFVGGVRVGATNMGGPGGYQGYCWTILVPNGSTYQISYNASATYRGWWELRA